jgi:hypothetical protein
MPSPSKKVQEARAKRGYFQEVERDDGSREQRRRISFADLQQHYREIVSKPDEQPSKLRALARSWNNIDDYDDGFSGDHPDKVLAKFGTGVDLPGGNADVIPVALEGEGPAWRWTDDEGEYDHSEFLSGEPEFYLDRRIEKSKPGIYIEVGLCYVWSAPLELIADFGRWVGQAIQAIQTRGFDICLDIVTPGTNAYPGETATYFRNAVTVKRFGEVLNARDFNVMFLGEGFRQLLFSYIALPEKREGIPIAGNMGQPLHTDWVVEFNPESRTLTFQSKGVPSSNEVLPVEYLNDQLREIAEGF